MDVYYDQGNEPWEKEIAIRNFIKDVYDGENANISEIAGGDLQPASADASFRRYFRVQKGDTSHGNRLNGRTSVIGTIQLTKIAPGRSQCRQYSFAKDFV